MSSTHYLTKKSTTNCGVKKRGITLGDIINGEAGLDVSHPLLLRDERLNIAVLCTWLCTFPSTLTGIVSPISQIEHTMEGAITSLTFDIAKVPCTRKVWRLLTWAIQYFLNKDLPNDCPNDLLEQSWYRMLTYHCSILITYPNWCDIKRKKKYGLG